MFAGRQGQGWLLLTTQEYRAACAKYSPISYYSLDQPVIQIDDDTYIIQIGVGLVSFTVNEING